MEHRHGKRNGEKTEMQENDLKIITRFSVFETGTLLSWLSKTYSKRRNNGIFIFLGIATKEESTM